MTSSSSPSSSFEEQQKQTKIVSAKELVQGKQLTSKITWDNLPEPYLMLRDGGQGEMMAKAINILATQKGYRVVCYTMDSHNEHYVIVEKAEKRKS